MNQFKSKAIAVAAAAAMAAAAVPVCVFTGADSPYARNYADEAVTYVLDRDGEPRDICGLPEIYFDDEEFTTDWEEFTDEYQYDGEEIICELPTFDPIGGGVTAVPNAPDAIEKGVTLPEQTFSYRLGDVNMDGKIKSNDARLTLRAAARLESLSDLQLLLADVNGDKKVQANDARSILRIAAKLDPAPQEFITVSAE